MVGEYTFFFLSLKISSRIINKVNIRSLTVESTKLSVFQSSLVQGLQVRIIRHNLCMNINTVIRADNFKLQRNH